MFKRSLVSIVLAASCGVSSADSLSDANTLGIASDFGMTAAALISGGFLEVNPLGPLIIPLKFLVKSHIDSIPNQYDRRDATAKFSGIQLGAAGSGACTLLGAALQLALACAAVTGLVMHSRVMGTTIHESACVNSHLKEFETAATAGRTYTLNLSDCSEVKT